MQLLFLFLSIFGSTQANAPLELSAKKILLLKVDSTGIIIVGNDSLNSYSLATYIYDRLYGSFKGTGRMHNKIKLETENSNIPDKIIEAISNAIMEGQKRALTNLSIQKYSDQFENISTRRQDKLRKKFPVLFQTDFK